MGQGCDGGGNRELSRVKLEHKPELQHYFGRTHGDVAAGVCSIQTNRTEEPWIVCPRRLLALGRVNSPAIHQKTVINELLHLLPYPSGTKLGIWSEVKLKYAHTIEGAYKSFDYTFDYILCPLGTKTGSELASIYDQPWGKVKRKLERTGYSIVDENTHESVIDVPVGAPSILEIMTSSTSGGNKNKRSTIPLAFEDALLDKPHEAPTINKRQVWARMVSQLIVKSEVGHEWGGKTIWLLQKNLAAYIEQTTGLDLHKLTSQALLDVNVLSFAYGDMFRSANSILPLDNWQLFAGTLNYNQDHEHFHAMIHAPCVPPINLLYSRLMESIPSGQLIVP